MSAERNWKKPVSEGEVSFIRPSKLTDDDANSVLLEGIFVESFPNHYDETKLDYKFEKEDGSVAILNGAGNLGYRMKAVNVGDYVQITYFGKQEITKGKMKGRLSHNFEVLVAED